MKCYYCGVEFIPIKKGQRFHTPQCSKKYHHQVLNRRRHTTGRVYTKGKNIQKEVKKHQECEGYWVVPAAVPIPDLVKQTLRHGLVQPRV